MIVDETPEVDPAAPRATVASIPVPAPWRAVAGLVSGAVATTSGLVVAAIAGVASPIDAVGSSFIDRVPRWLKELAIDWFGTNDKTALRIGIVIVLALVAIAFGVASRERPTPLVAAIVAFAVIGSLSAAERPGSTFWSVAAPFVGAAVGVAAAVALLARLDSHWRRASRPGPSRAPEGWDRRGFLLTAGALGGVSVVAGVVGRRGEVARIERIEEQRPELLPSVDDSGPGVDLLASDDGFHPSQPWITPTENFYRIDTALSFPRIEVADWKLTIDGLVDRPLEISWDDLLSRPQVERVVTLCCVSNDVGGPYIGNAVWQGVLLADLLDEAGVRPEAEQVFSRSLDGWTCGFPVPLALDGRDAMVAIGMNGEPLTILHGFPARLVVPGLYGYVSATKWLSSITLNRWDDDEGYWMPRGWSRLGPVKTQSRIDRPRRSEVVSSGSYRVAGVAWAQHTGIERVEVRVDDGDWNDAILSNDVTDDAWRQWVFEWDAQPGEHRLQVRATDKSGYVQTETVQGVVPDGATGWHTRTVTVE